MYSAKLLLTRRWPTRLEIKYRLVAPNTTASGRSAAAATCRARPVRNEFTMRCPVVRGDSALLNASRLAGRCVDHRPGLHQRRRGVGHARSVVSILDASAHIDQ